MRRSPVYKAINKPLTIMGVDRRLFFAALSLGAGIWNMFNTISGALTALTVAVLVGRWITQTDPQLPRIVLNSGAFRDQYDPAKSD
ncbi:MAG TPA: VirB3 family type IV secretion system protein [Vicinamibacteria bacterium]|jgi:type IV secretory pathway TrbD component|nr:VirB3 family type IV secretion system protein [Vicinamibacteria bacterium]